MGHGRSQPLLRKFLTHTYVDFKNVSVQIDFWAQPSPSRQARKSQLILEEMV